MHRPMLRCKAYRRRRRNYDVLWWLWRRARWPRGRKWTVSLESCVVRCDDEHLCARTSDFSIRFQLQNGVGNDRVDVAASQGFGRFVVDLPAALLSVLSQHPDDMIDDRR